MTPRSNYSVPALFFLGAFLLATLLVAPSAWAEEGAAAAPSEIDLMIGAITALESTGNQPMADVLKRAVNARQIRQLGNLGNLTAADYELLKSAPTRSKETAALEAAVASLKATRKADEAAPLIQLLKQRETKASTGRSRTASVVRSGEVARLEAKVDRIRRMLEEVEAELASLKAR